MERLSREREYVCVCVIILEHIHLLRQVVAGQAVEEAQVRFPGDGHPHDLVQVPGGSSSFNQWHVYTTFFFCSKYNKIIKAKNKVLKNSWGVSVTAYFSIVPKSHLGSLLKGIRMAWNAAIFWATSAEMEGSPSSQVSSLRLCCSWRDFWRMNCEKIYQTSLDMLFALLITQRRPNL